jgi:hypothetical protein
MWVVFSPSVGKKFGGSKWKGMLLRTSSVEAAYLSGVYVILILKVWQASKGQQSSTMLNASTSSKKYEWSFLSYVWLW